MIIFFEKVFEIFVDLALIFIAFFIAGIAGAVAYAVYELGLSSSEIESNVLSAGRNFTVMQILFNSLIFSSLVILTARARAAMTKSKGTQ